jgi:hypothetical protein
MQTIIISGNFKYHIQAITLITIELKLIQPKNYLDKITINLQCKLFLIPQERS